MCQVAWCAAYTAGDSAWCVVHRDHPEYVPRKSKKQWFKQEQKAIAISQSEDQTGGQKR